jgi:ribonuclease-3 family protein
MEKDLMDSFEGMIRTFSVEGKDSLPKSAVLAYIGDAIYELYMRTRVIEEGKTKINDIHKSTVKIVRAGAQEKTIFSIIDMLNDDEREVFRKGRNIKTQSVPKNASVSSYRHATGFEALLGYLYYKGQYQRLAEILNLAYEANYRDK